MLYCLVASVPEGVSYIPGVCTHHVILFGSVSTSGCVTHISNIVATSVIILKKKKKKKKKKNSAKSLLNPYLKNGFSHRYQLGESTFIFRGVRSDFYFLSYF